MQQRTTLRTRQAGIGFIPLPVTSKEELYDLISERAGQGKGKLNEGKRPSVEDVGRLCQFPYDTLVFVGRHLDFMHLCFKHCTVCDWVVAIVLALDKITGQHSGWKI